MDFLTKYVDLSFIFKKTLDKREILLYHIAGCETTIVKNAKEEDICLKI